MIFSFGCSGITINDPEFLVTNTSSPRFVRKIIVFKSLENLTIPFVGLMICCLASEVKIPPVWKVRIVN